MTTKLFIALFGLMTYSLNIIAQQPYNPYKSIGKEANVLTLSNGKYDEFFDTDSLEVIGSAVLNTRTMKVIGFITQDTLYSEATLEPEIVSRWLSPDPLARKYPNLSPYNFVANSPIFSIDPDGRDIIVLNNPNGASGYGHMAVLVGNDKTGWTFVSKEGRDKTHWYSPDNKFGELIGGPALEPKIRVYTSLDAFKKAQATDENLGAYTQNVRLTATTEQDNTALKTTKESAKNYYNALFSNCADAVSDGLKAAGFDPGYKTVGTSVDDNPWSSGNDIKTLSPQPTQRFNEIVKNNKEKTVTTFPTTNSNEDGSTNTSSSDKSTNKITTGEN